MYLKHKDQKPSAQYMCMDPFSRAKLRLEEAHALAMQGPWWKLKTGAQTLTKNRTPNSIKRLPRVSLSPVRRAFQSTEIAEGLADSCASQGSRAEA